MTYEGWVRGATAPAPAFAALADATRRTVFERLGEGPLSVVEIARGMPVSRPAVSQHLKVLRAAGLVDSTRDGNRHMYRISERGLVALRDYVDRFWDVALASFKEAAETERKGEER